VFKLFVGGGSFWSRFCRKGALRLNMKVFQPKSNTHMVRVFDC
jgi:hypothetical protein